MRANVNVRIHVYIAAGAIIAGYLLGLSRVDYLILIVMVVLVISAEMINTAIEEMTNLITTEHRREAKIAKDVSAGMVLVSSIGAIVVGIIIFLPSILEMF